MWQFIKDDWVWRSIVSQHTKTREKICPHQITRVIIGITHQNVRSNFFPPLSKEVGFSFSQEKISWLTIFDRKQLNFLAIVDAMFARKVCQVSAPCFFFIMSLFLLRRWITIIKVICANNLATSLTFKLLQPQGFFVAVALSELDQLRHKPV